eukprot:2994553-Pyramimonas_sp.AAC.1
MSPWPPLLQQLLEVSSDEFTHYNGYLQHASKIDRVILAAPSWLLTQMHVSAKVRDLPETLEQRGISDHAPLQITLQHRPPQPKDPSPSQSRYSNILIFSVSWKSSGGGWISFYARRLSARACAKRRCEKLPDLPGMRCSQVSRRTLR